MSSIKEKKQKGYSITEAKKEIDIYIDKSAIRLNKNLQSVWKQHSRVAKKLSYA